VVGGEGGVEIGVGVGVWVWVGVGVYMSVLSFIKRFLNKTQNIYHMYLLFLITEGQPKY